MNKPAHDVIIVGQGLAGSILAITLINAGLSVLVLDNNHKHSSSVVAAGIINPITGHRLNKTEGFEHYYSFAKSFYLATQTQLASQFWQESAQLRLIKNAGQQDFFQRRLKQQEYTSILQKFNDLTPVFSNSLPVASVASSAILNSPAFLTACKKWLLAQGRYQDCRLDYGEIRYSARSIKAGKHEARFIIFCEGYQASYNPWLKHLPFKLSKGEVIGLKYHPCPDTILNWGHWLIPSEGGAKLGSNYEWQNMSLTPTPAVKQTLLQSAIKHLHHYQSGSLQGNSEDNVLNDVLSHDVGIRPTTADRPAFIGPISNLKQAYCFNGFGSKGCLLIPYFAQLLSEHLLNGLPLPNTVSRWL